MSTFFKLVRHEMKFPASSTSFIKKLMSLITFVVFLGLTIGIVLGLENGMGNFQYFNQTFNGIMFVAFGMGMGFINKEFQKNTASWWLTLPYSRELLYRAKFLSIMIYYLYVYLYSYLIIKASIITAITYTGKWSQFSLSDVFHNDLIFFLTSFLGAMLLGTYAICIMLFTKKFKAVSIILWIPFGLIAGFMMPNFLMEMVMPAANGESISIPIHLLIGSPILTTLLYIFGVHLLKKHTNL
ncbi:hypothetical protein [Baia soyae]|uniref:ABC-2 family transporter n=1 Tax=Baia soyae TaxID=1544746 RepID=A0A4R2RZ01_9BACL|nr:hypothetical protein [Baia soyae]TCP68798.1 hypothetical protein EDD57_11538 [Baia soyae]